MNLISKLSKSNSTEIQHLTPNLVNLLMGKEKSSQDIIINELEQVFLKNNLPMMAKIYKVFDGKIKDYKASEVKKKITKLYNSEKTKYLTENTFIDEFIDIM